jgi:cell division septal protein FtsQ
MWFRKKQRNKRHHRRNVLDVKLRSDHVRATRARSVAVLLGALFGTVFTLYVLWRSGEWLLDRLVYQNRAFAIQVVEVSTDGEISVDQLRRWSGVRAGQNLMALDLARVKRNLELVPNIQNVSVERLLPRKLRIQVAERKPIARVYLPRLSPEDGLMVQTWLLDADGAVVMPLEDKNRQVPAAASEQQFPVLTGVSQGELRLGRCVESSRIRAAIQLVQAFNSSRMATVVGLRSVQVDEPGVLVALTDSGTRVTFGCEGFEKQLLRWREIHEQSRRLNKVILSVDLAVRNNVPVRWEDASIPRSKPATDTPPTRSRRGNV